jgi:cell division protein FtsW
MMIAAVIGLLVLGTIMVGSASISLADRNTGEPLYYLWRHVGALGVGLHGRLVRGDAADRAVVSAELAAARLGLGLLVLVLVPGFGHTVNGSTRWLIIGPLTMQASEPARVCLLFYLASYMRASSRGAGRELHGLHQAGAIMAIAACCCSRSRTSAPRSCSRHELRVLFVGGARLRDFSFVARSARSHSRTRDFLDLPDDRLTAFLDPWADPYRERLSAHAVADRDRPRRLVGVGLGASVQKLFYLPEAHTDFVFAVLAEELGLIGSTS